VRGILRNPAYAGRALTNRTQVAPARRRRSALLPAGPGESHAPRPPEEWIEVPVPPVVSEETFAQVQAKLDANQQGAARNTRHEYLLRALVSCGACRLACSCRQPAGGYRYYLCRGRTDPLRAAEGQRCTARYIPAGQLDELVWADLCALMTDPAQVARALEQAQGGAWLPQELQARQAAVRQALGQLERQQQRLLDAYLAEIIALAELQRKRQELDRRHTTLLTQQRQLNAAAGQRLELQAIAHGIEAFCQAVRAGLATATFDQRRQLAELLIDRVIVTDSDVEIRYVLPTSPEGPHRPFCQLRKDHLDQLLDTVRPVDAGAPVADHDVAPAGQRLAHQEQVADPAALVLIILPGRPARRDRLGRVDLAGQLAAGLVQADLRVARVIGPGVNLKYVLHAPAELGILLGRDAPALGQPRLEAVCFKACRTVSYDTDSTTSSSTSRSASSRNVQRLRPRGGALHASATRWASCSPSSRRRYWRTGALRYTAASSPAATYRMRTRATVAGLTSSAAPMAASVQPGPAWPWLAFNKMRAWVSALAGATPRPIIVCSRARSSSDRTTMCRLRISASCGGGIPGRYEHETEPRITQVTTDELLGLIRPARAGPGSTLALACRRECIWQARKPAMGSGMRAWKAGLPCWSQAVSSRSPQRPTCTAPERSMNRCSVFPSPSMTTSRACSTRTAPCSASLQCLKSAGLATPSLGGASLVLRRLSGAWAPGVWCSWAMTGMDQDGDGIWTAPGGDKAAWFADPDGNILSLNQSL